MAWGEALKPIKNWRIAGQKGEAKLQIVRIQLRPRLQYSLMVSH